MLSFKFRSWPAETGTGSFRGHFPDDSLGTAWVWFRLRPCGFTPRDLRDHLVALTGLTPHSITPGRITYDLRRLRLHGFIERLSKTHRYPVTEFGLRASLFFTRVPARILRSGLSRRCRMHRRWIPPYNTASSTRLIAASRRLQLWAYNKGSCPRLPYLPGRRSPWRQVGRRG